MVRIVEVKSRLLAPLQNSAAKAVAVFGLLKMACSFLAWFLSEGTDKTYRRRLDKTWDLLHAMTFGKLANVLVRRLSKKLDEMMPVLRRNAAAVFLALSLINAALMILSLSVAAGIRADSGSADALRPWVTVVRSGDYQLSALMYGGYAAICNIVGLYVARKLLRRHAFEDRNLTQLGLTALYSAGTVYAGVSALSMAGSRIGILVGTIWTHETVRGVPVIQGHDITDTLWLIITGARIGEGEVARVLILAASILLPVIMFITIALLAILARSMSGRLQEAMKRLIYLVSTDTRPLLSQLGNVLGACGAVVSLLIDLVKSRL